MKLYHGTAGENVLAILKHGIKSRRLTKKNNWKHSVASHEHAVQIKPPHPTFYLVQSLSQTLQPSEFVTFVVVGGTLDSYTGNEQGLWGSGLGDQGRGQEFKLLRWLRPF